MFFNLFTFHVSVRQFSFICCLCLLVVGSLNVTAQQTIADTANKTRIIIANTGTIDHFTTDTGSFNKFVTDVIVYQGTDTLYCDSLFHFLDRKQLEAYGNVRIAQQGGTEGTCNYLRYSADKKLAFMYGDVQLTDGKNKLWCEELTYDLGSKTGVFTHDGTLQSDSTIVSSNSGVYNMAQHEARFTGNVIILDPQYKIASNDLGYNTETKIETFYDYSVVTSDGGKSVLTTWNGTYDSKNVIAQFSGHSSIWNDGQYIEADSMHYDKASGYGFAIGHVISVDTTQHVTIYCGRADYFRKQRVLWAIIKPVMELANGKDTFYMRADTFYSAPMVHMPGSEFRMPQDTTDKQIDTTPTTDSVTLEPISSSAIIKNITNTGNSLPDKSRLVATPAKKSPEVVIDEEGKTEKDEPERIDSMWVIPNYKYRLDNFIIDTTRTMPLTNSGKNKKKRLPSRDTIAKDTTAPIFFTGYHHVIIYSDSMQARCDSVAYTRSDSIVRLMYNPIAWARGSQITGDTILMQLDTAGVKSMYIPNQSFMTSRSGPEKAELFDQVQGKSLTAFFKNNAISKMFVYPDAESIYYSKDDGGAYVGLSQATSVLMRIYFGEESISKIKFEQDVHQTVTPLEKADLPNARLRRFKWLYDQRPKSKDEIFK